MANPQEYNSAGLLAGRGCGVISLASGTFAFMILFWIRHWNVAALGEPAGTVFSIAVTWLLVVLPICGFGLGVLGIARDRQKGLAIIATLVNVLGLIVAGLIIAILTG
jgi:hypothetical protein